MTRHEAREQAFAVIFEKNFNENISFQEIIGNAEESGLVKVNGFASSIFIAQLVSPGIKTTSFSETFSFQSKKISSR